MVKIIRYKPAVRVIRSTPAIEKIVDTAERLMHTHAWIPELVVTSINDGEHKLDSRHYLNQAVDIRSKNFTTYNDKDKFVVLIQAELGPQFLVLLESVGTDNEHFHIQVKRGATYP